MTLHKRIFLILLLLEMLITICLGILFFINKTEGLSHLDTGIKASDFLTDYMSYDNGWHLEDGLVTEEVELLYGPHAFLDRGSYTLMIVYDCDKELEVRPIVVDGYSDYLLANPFVLDPNIHLVTYDFAVREPIDSFEVGIYYPGKGNISISDISVYRNLNPLKRTIFCMVLLIIITTIFYSYRGWFLNNHKMVLCLTFITVLISLPLYARGINLGVDLPFHLGRIEGLSQEIQRGVIPAYIQSFWMNGNGYPVSIYYGDALLYIPALLRIIGFSVISSYKIYVFLINIITVIVSYASFYAISKNHSHATLMCLAYASSAYRIQNMYISAAVGVYTAMSFLPLIAVAIYHIYSYSPTEKIDIKSVLTDSALLAFGMSQIVLCNILSVLLTIVTVVIICIFNIKKTFRRYTISVYSISALFALLLCLYFVVPFIDYYINEDVHVKHVELTIQSSGAYILQLFSFFQTPFGHVWGPMNERYLSTPGILLMMTFVLAIWLCLTSKQDRMVKLFLGYAALILFMSTNLFPWDYLGHISAFRGIVSNIQFPLRFLSPASVILTILLGLILDRAEQKLPNEQYRNISYTVVALSLIGIFVFCSQYISGTDEVTYLDSVELSDSAMGNREYLRADSEGNPVFNDNTDIIAQDASVMILSRNGSEFVIDVTTDSKTGIITLPLNNYKGYCAKDSSGNVFEVFDNSNYLVTFEVPPGYHDTIKVAFIPPWYWRLSAIVSLAAWIILIAYILFKVRGHVKESSLQCK